MSTPPGPEAPRHAIDQVACLTIEGWALSGSGQAVEVGLGQGDELIPCHLERLPRPDVLQHLGLPTAGTALDCGFLLRPDGATWFRRFGWQAAACTLVLDGQPAADIVLGLTEAELCAWLDTLAPRPPDDAERIAERQRLGPFIDAAGDALTNWAQARWAEPGAPSGVRHAVDRVDGLHIAGWAWAPGGGGEHFTLRCGRQVWLLDVHRTERLDVLQALPGAGTHAGFELDLPAAIWLATGPEGGAWVQVCVNEQPLWPRPLRVARQAPLQALTRAASLAHEGDQAGRPGLWALLDHALAAGVWDEVTAPVYTWVRNALSEDERALLPRPRTMPSAATTGHAAPDEDTVAVWRQQQRFNQALAVGSDLAAALDEVLAQAPAPSLRARQSFLASLVPTFCAARALTSLRDRLGFASDQEWGEQTIAELVPGDDRWAQSLRLPLLVDAQLPSGRLTGAVDAAAHLGRAGAGGWLNTASLRASLATVREALDQGQAVDDEELHQFVDHLLALWADLGADPCWSRLPDQALIEAQVVLLTMTPSLGEDQAARVVGSALHLYALTPAFWQALDTGWPAHRWPVQLADAAARVRPVLAAVAGDPHALAREPAQALFAWARRLGCVDAPAWQRHALAAARHLPGLATALADGLPPADGWRVAESGLDALQAWQAIDPVPPPEHAARQAAAWQAWRARPRDVPGAWRAVAGERAGFTGLALVAGWAADDVQRLASLSDLIDQTLAVCERRRAQHPVPPAALCMALAAMAGAGAAHAAACQAWRTRAEALWGAALIDRALGRPAVPRHRARLAGAGVLVLRRGEPGPTPPWAADLHEAHAPWFDLAHWCPGGEAQPGTSALPFFTAPGLWPLLRQLLADTDHGSFVILPADAEPSVDAWLARTSPLGSHYAGPASTAAFVRLRPGAEPGAPPRVDASPAATRFAPVDDGLVLSRAAAAWALARLDAADGPAWAQAAIDDDRRLGDVLVSLGVVLDERGQVVQHARPPALHNPVAAFADAPDPGPGSPTVMRLGPPLPLPLPHAPGATRLWPSDRAPSLVGRRGSQQLVRLSDPWAAVAPAEEGEVAVFAVARNERVLMPHFLAHYRAFGVRRFVIADNLSTDGTREYLLAQPDVLLYSVDTPYKLSHYGVAWQQAMLAEHAQGRWALVVDIDELLVWPGCERETLAARCGRLAADGHDAALALMVDMYPEGPLDSADFERGAPFAEAPCFDKTPALPWRLGSGSYSNSPSFVSSARHRLLPGSPPNHYTAQKVPLVRYTPALRWSEGLHYAAGVQRAPEPLFLAHFKYHRGFRAKVEEEVARRQHYNDAEEYRKYRALWAEARGIMFDPAVSRRWVDSHSFADIAWT